jgi:Photoprotection regulator fluorescence recovery protein
MQCGLLLVGSLHGHSAASWSLVPNSSHPLIGSAIVSREDEIMRVLKGSPSEKLIARRAFEKALKMELQEMIGEAKKRAAAVNEVSQLWRLESWLTQRRLEIDRKYDYRYSVLPLVFAVLVKECRMSEKDLHGLDTEKIELIFGVASRV